MKKEEIRSHSINEIKQFIHENTELLADLRYTHAISPIENPMRLRTLRREIARMITILTELENKAK